MEFKLLNILLFFLLLPNIKTMSQISLKYEFSLVGDYPGDNFSVVTGLGDINNDGFDDFAVGSPDSNYVKIFFGKTVFDSLNFLKIKNDTDSDYRSAFGFCIAGKGDLNADGFNDLVISNPYHGDYMSGALYVYMGKNAKLSSTPDYEIYGPRLNSQFGYSISISGDIDGDGYDDILVGAPFYLSDFNIYFGGETINTTPNITIKDSLNEEFLGISVSIIDDLNQDGKDEFMVGKPSSFLVDSSKAYLFYGGDIRTIGFEYAIAFSKIKDEALGNKVTGLGDINYDGYKDFAIMSRGSILIYCSNKENIYKSPLIIEKDMSKGHFMTIENIGDINRDNFSDFIIGSENPANNYSGLIDVYFGSKDTLELFTTISGDTPHSYFGSYISNIGSIQGDSIQYIAVGGKRYPTGIPDKNHSEIKIYSYQSVTDMKRDQFHKYDYKLYQNYPNPCNPETKISFSVPHEVYVTLIVYNILGEELMQLINKTMVSGYHTINLNLTNLPSGIYIYNIQAGEFIETKKMVLLR